MYPSAEVRFQNIHSHHKGNLLIVHIRNATQVIGTDLSPIQAAWYAKSCPANIDTLVISFVGFHQTADSKLMTATSIGCFRIITSSSFIHAASTEALRTGRTCSTRLTSMLDHQDIAPPTYEKKRSNFSTSQAHKTRRMGGITRDLSWNLL